jgi:hypothetical protein
MPIFFMTSASANKFVFSKEVPRARNQACSLIDILKSKPLDWSARPHGPQMGFKRSVGRKYNEKPMKRFNTFIMMVAALVVAAAMVWWAFS